MRISDWSSDVCSSDLGQFSMPFLAAVALLDGEVSWDSYARRLGDPEINRLMQRVDVVQDPEVEALFPASFGARVAIQLKDGRRLEQFEIGRASCRERVCQYV